MSLAPAASISAARPLRRPQRTLTYSVNERCEIPGVDLLLSPGEEIEVDDLADEPAVVIGSERFPLTGEGRKWIGMHVDEGRLVEMAAD